MLDPPACGMCGYCRTLWADMNAAIRARMWDMLPAQFDMLPWPQLRDPDAE